MEEEEKEKEEIIELTNEITPPVDGSKKEWDWKPLRDKMWLEKKAKQEEESGGCTSVGGIYALNPALKGATEEYHRRKNKNYIVGERTPDDKQYCEKVDPLDLYNTAEIRKYLLAVEKFTTQKENQRSIDESRNRLWKYIVSYLLGVFSILWALYAGMINLTQ